LQSFQPRFSDGLVSCVISNGEVRPFLTTV
jgi:hypothetical protein